MKCYKCSQDTVPWIKIDGIPFCYDCWANGITDEDLK